MAVTAAMLRRLGALRLAPAAMAEVLSIIAEAQESEETRLERQREKKRQQRAASKDSRGTVSGQGGDKAGDPSPSPSPPAPPLTSSPSNPPSPPKGGSSPTGIQAFHDWNDIAKRTGLPQAQSLTEPRRRQLVARLHEVGLEGWRAALAKVEASPFLTGDNDRGWRADLDFVLKPANFVKITEGKYDRATGPPRNGHAKPRTGSQEMLDVLREEFPDAGRSPGQDHAQPRDFGAGATIETSYTRRDRR